VKKPEVKDDKVEENGDKKEENKKEEDNKVVEALPGVKYETKCSSI